MHAELRSPENGQSQEGRYSNYAEVGFNAFEFLLEFGQLYAENEQARLHTKIVMSPHYANRFLEMLQKSVSQYEHDFGAGATREAGALTGGAAGTPLTARMMAPAVTTPAGSMPAATLAATSQQINDAVKALLDVLKTYLPPPGGAFPAPSVAIASVTERSLGLNNRRGEDARAGFGVVQLKGGRLEVVARFELWAAQPGAVEQAIQDLIARLLADRDKLWTLGFLRITLEGASSSENVPVVPAWRQTADVRVLYEFHFEDADDSQGLIARIPIQINSTYNQLTTVTDEMTRWDNQDAPSLQVRGPVTVSTLSALLFVAGAAPTGSVTLTRTFDGASGPPTQFATLPGFLAAVNGPNAIRNAQVVFASWSNFFAIFTASGSPVVLGPDSYSPMGATLNPAVTLTAVEDTIEIAYEKTALEVNAVAYLRAK